MNTELRELTDVRVFDHVDFVTLDAGERPLLALAGASARSGVHPSDWFERSCGLRRRIRTRPGPAAGHPAVRYVNWNEPDIAFAEVGTPTWDGLPLDRYLSLLDMLNPMNRLWSDGRWNKLTVAHGCYWKKCSFCDVSLDYISRYERCKRFDTLVDRIETIVAETGQTGFHFVDEAAPPKALKSHWLTELMSSAGSASRGGATFDSRNRSRPSLCEATRRQRLHRDFGWARSGVRPIAEADEEGRFSRPGGPRDARIQRCRHIGSRLSDVWVPDPDRAGHRRCTRIRAAIVRGRLHPIGVLPSLSRAQCIHLSARRPKNTA